MATDNGIAVKTEDRVDSYADPRMFLKVPRDVENNLNHVGFWVSDILHTPDGRVWIATPQGLYVCTHAPDHSLTNWTFYKPAEQISMKKTRHLNNVGTLTRLSDGTIALGTSSSGLILVNPVTLTFTHALSHWNRDAHVMGVAEDGKGALWIAGFDHAVLRYDRKTGQATTPARMNLENLYFRAVAVDDADGVWVCNNDGAWLFAADGTTRHYTEKDVLPSNILLDIWKAGDGSIWLRDFKGYSRFSAGTWTYPRFPGIPTPDSRLIETGDGSTWVASKKGVFRNPKVVLEMEPAWKRELATQKAAVEAGYPELPAEAPAGRWPLWRSWIARDGRKRIWLGSWEVLLRYDGKTWTDLSGDLSGHWVTFLRSDATGGVWVGTMGSGVLRYAGTKKQAFNTRSGCSSVAYIMVEDPNGDVFVGTQDGIFRWSTGTWAQILPGFQVIDLKLRPGGGLLFESTNCGLYEWTAAKGAKPR